MITLKPSKKPDYKFIGISLCALALLTIFSFAFKPKDPEAVDLKDTYDPQFSKLVISEIVSSNPGVYVDENNLASDYIELFNGSNKEINLKGYGLSDREDKIKWAFPEIVIAPKEYIVVSLSEQEGSGLTAPFKLSSKGEERIILTNAKSRIIDGVDTVALSKGQAMIRDEKGNWQISDVLTPGFENSVNGHNEYLASLSVESEDALIINEFLTGNNGNYIAKDGSDGYIELLNNSNSSIDLSEYYLSNDVQIPFKYHLEGTLAPEKILLISLDDSIFNLRSSNGNLVLSKNGKIINNIEYSNLNKGSAYIYEDGKYVISSIISPSKPNTIEGIDEFNKEYASGNSGLIISEVMNKNTKYLVQNGNQYYDWIELYNNSDETIYLGNYSLNTDLKDDDRYALEDIELGSHEYYVVMCSGDVSLSNDTYKHLPFKIGKNEGIFLYEYGKLSDCVYLSNVPVNSSYGRYKDEGFFYIDSPSPGYENSRGYRKISASPTVSLAPGIYDGPVEVEIYGNGNIYYTLDGYNPDEYSLLYEGGTIKIDETSTLKIRAYKDNERYSDLSINSYIINENHTMPVLSLSIDARDFSNLNANSWQNGLEKQCYMELFEENKTVKSLCSISLFGGNARAQAKKAYCIRFDSEWGAKQLDYQLFPNRDNAAYDAFVLRSGSSDWTLSIIRDIVGTSLVDDYTDVDVQAYKPVVAYINGDYWGIYNLREKVNSHFVEEHHNVPKDSISIFRIDGEVECGSRASYDELRRYCNTHDLRNDEYYQYVCDRINVVNFADYWIAEGYFTNNDLLNVRLFSSPYYDDGKFHYIFYDLDFAWYNVSANWYTQYITSPGGMTSHNYENDIIRALMTNSDFRSLWLERLSYHLNNTFLTENVIGRIDEIVSVYEPEIERNQRRWGLSVSEWENEVEKLRVFARHRTDAYLSSTKNFFGLTNDEMKEIFGDIYN